MNQRQLRWLVVALCSGAVAWVVLRQRRSALQGLPEIVEEWISLPIGPKGDKAPSQAAEVAALPEERLTRKVGRNRKISVHGKLYGPLEPTLIGAQVDVEERDDQIVVWSDDVEVGSFERQG